MPTNFTVTCHAPPSMFAYPKVEEKKGDEKKVVTTAVLSTTVKAKAREARKEARKLGRHMSMSSTGGGGTADKDPLGATGETPILPRVDSYMSTTSYISTEEIKPPTSGEDLNKAKKEKEPSSFIITNPSRVTSSQIRFLSLHSDDSSPGSQRYLPVDVGRRAAPFGIVMLIDEEPSLPELVEKVERIAIGQGDEADKPEPFEWDPNDD